MVKRKLHGFLSLEHNQLHSEQQDLGGKFRRKLGNEYDHQRGKFRMVKRKLHGFLSLEHNHFHHEFGTQLCTQHSVG